MLAPRMNQPPDPLQPRPTPGAGLSTGCIIGLVVAGIGVVLVGVMASLAIYGTRKYLAAAKTAEAKNTIGAIARGAVAAYERDTPRPDGTVTHVLCESSGPVPATLQSASKYMPSPTTDFQTPGWKCLRFSVAMPIYYQYQYNRGAGYLAASVSPGPDGFEAAAQGDLNGDGIRSTFALSGKITSSGEVVVNKAIYIENEFD